jgi:ppGpp synthetase/RelA/SpoT-type nucleotidyltranferase
MFGDDVPRSEIGRVYPASLPVLESCASTLQPIVEQFCRVRGIKVQTVEARAKTLASLVEKFERHPDYERLSDAEDLCGVRVVTFYLDDVSAVRDVLRKEFDILREEDRRAASPEAFGYQSLHMIARWGSQRRSLTEYQAFGDFKIEFQIRTVLQHAWGVISHSLDYKSEGDIPAEVRRKLFRMAAILETGDEIFGAFRTEVDSLRARYRHQVSTEDWRHLPLNLDSVIASWDRLPAGKVHQVAVRAGFAAAEARPDPHDPTFRYSISGLVSIAKLAGFGTVGDLAARMESLDSMQEMLHDLTRESAKRGFTLVGDPWTVVVMAMLLEEPSLRVRGAMPFRPGLEDALDAVINVNDKDT